MRWEQKKTLVMREQHNTKVAGFLCLLSGFAAVAAAEETRASGQGETDQCATTCLQFPADHTGARSEAPQHQVRVSFSSPKQTLVLSAGPAAPPVIRL